VVISTASPQKVHRKSGQIATDIQK